MVSLGFLRFENSSQQLRIGQETLFLFFNVCRIQGGMTRMCLKESQAGFNQTTYQSQSRIVGRYMLELEVVIVIFDFVDIQNVSPFGMCVGMVSASSKEERALANSALASSSGPWSTTVSTRSSASNSFFFYEWEAEAVRLAVARGLTVSKIRSWVFLIFLHLVFED